MESFSVQVRSIGTYSSNLPGSARSESERSQRSGMRAVRLTIYATRRPVRVGDGIGGEEHYDEGAGKAKSLVGNCFSHAGKMKSHTGNRFSCVGKVKSLAGNHFSCIGKAKSLVGNCFSRAGKVKSHTGNRFSCMGKPKSTRGKSFFRWKKRNPTRRRCFWRAVELYRLVRFVAHPESACAVG